MVLVKDTVRARQSAFFCRPCLGLAFADEELSLAPLQGRTVVFWSDRHTRKARVEAAGEQWSSRKEVAAKRSLMRK